MGRKFWSFSPHVGQWLKDEQECARDHQTHSQDSFLEDSPKTAHSPIWVGLPSRAGKCFCSLAAVHQPGWLTLGEEEQEAQFYAQVKAMSSSLSSPLIYPSPMTASQLFTIRREEPLKPIHAVTQWITEEDRNFGALCWCSHSLGALQEQAFLPVLGKAHLKIAGHFRHLLIQESFTLYPIFQARPPQAARCIWTPTHEVSAFNNICCHQQEAHIQWPQIWLFIISQGGDRGLTNPLGYMTCQQRSVLSPSQCDVMLALTIHPWADCRVNHN